MTIRSRQKNLKILCPQCEHKLNVSGMKAFEQTACPECQLNVVVPRRFGQYLLELPLSETAITGVYRAVDLKLQREVAVKILDLNVVEKPEAVDGFLSAARKNARLNHTNILPIYSCGTYDDHPYVAMEFCSDGSLADLIRESETQISASRALTFAIHTVRGLQAASQHNVKHGHITPGNILLAADQKIKVADFGFALALEADDKGSKELRYTSPELFRNEEWDYRSDIYSLGCVIYYLLTGIPPFVNDYAARMKGVNSVPQKQLREVRPELPREVEDFLNHCMAPTPESRPKSYHTVLKTLTHLSHLIQPSKQNLPDSGKTRAAKRKVVRRSRKVSGGQPEKGISPKKRLQLYILDMVILVLLLACLLVFAHGVKNEAPWYTAHVQPFFRWVARHVGVAENDAFQDQNQDND